ncbi:unnamed protein product, partial [Prorocentrum cordatum]
AAESTSVGLARSRCTTRWQSCGRRPPGQPRRGGWRSGPTTRGRRATRGRPRPAPCEVETARREEAQQGEGGDQQQRQHAASGGRSAAGCTSSTASRFSAQSTCSLEGTCEGFSTPSPRQMSPRSSYGRESLSMSCTPRPGALTLADAVRQRSSCGSRSSPLASVESIEDLGFAQYVSHFSPAQEPLVPHQRSDTQLVMHPELVMPHAHIHLAIPARLLENKVFTLDVLGLSGAPLLGASVVSEEDGTRTIRISQPFTGKILASCNSSLELLGPNSERVGNVCASARRDKEFCLKDASGTCRLFLRWEVEGQTMSILSSAHGEGAADIGTLELKEPGRLPRRHYEMVVRPGVDAVPPLASFLALMVFINPVEGIRRAAPRSRQATPRGLRGIYFHKQPSSP